MLLAKLQNIFKNLYFVLVIAGLTTYNLKAENGRKLDSLFTIIKTSKIDTVKINAQLKIANILIKEDSVKGLNELKKAFYSLQKVSDKNYVLRSIDRAGRICYKNDLFQKARQYYYLGIAKAKADGNKQWLSKYYLRVADQLQREDFVKLSILWFDSAIIAAKGVDEKLLADALKEKGRSHYDLGEYQSAMELYIQSLRLYEKNKWVNADYTNLLHYLGSVFKRQNLFDKALEYYEKQLQVSKILKDKNLEANALYLCAIVYGLKGNHEKDMEYVQNALKLFKEENNKEMESLMYASLGNNYHAIGNFEKGIYYMELSMKMDIELGKDKHLGDTYASLGDMYSRQGKHKKALEYLNKAMELTMKKESKQLLNKTSIVESMAFAYSNMGDYKSAFKSLLKHRILNDSLNNQSNAEYLNTLATQYQTEKKEQEIALLSADKKIKDEELLRKDAQSKTLIIVCVLVLIVAGVSIFAFINKRKTSKLLTKQVNEINYQNSIIKEKNKDITDSIQYAKRLQEAVFPEVDALNNYFAEAFVLFRPKDIVSGDFYWFDEVNKKTILIVGDCTGHGVPGAFMSILGHNLLNQIILEDKITDPSEILRVLDKNVSNALNKKASKKEYNDGMDIAICVVDKENNSLSFAGANRPLVIKRGSELFELKPNKFAVGGIEDDRCKLFGKHEIPIKENDILYLFSDGYYDQFGGPSGKKFKYKKLVDAITSIASLPLNEQKNILTNTFENWRGSLEQLDDVCVIGVKI